jgi:hypothetical protein
VIDAAAAVEAVRAKAIASWRDGVARQGDKFKKAVATDATTFGRGKRPSALIAIVNKAGSIVLAIDMDEYLRGEWPAWEMMLEFAGCTHPAPIEKAIKDKAAITKK